jgi:hypothetical protein
MPDASHHCKRSAAALSAVLTEEPAAKGGVAKNPQRAEGISWDLDGPAGATTPLHGRSYAKRSTAGLKSARRISNAKHEQADQARPNRRQPRLISRYVGTRKPIRRLATSPTIQA